MGDYGNVQVGMTYGTFAASTKKYPNETITNTQNIRNIDKGLITDQREMTFGSFVVGVEAEINRGFQINNFDYFAGKNNYAIDFNGNNKVDSDEIFEGKMNRNAYIKAKSSEEGLTRDNYLKLYNEYN